MIYILKPTIAKTLQANNYLEKTNQNKMLLFDFSLLEKHVFNNAILSEIKEQCFCNASVVNRYIWVHRQCDIWTSFKNYAGNLYFQPHIVYSNSKNKRVYVIMRLVKIEWLTFQERNSLYDEFKTSTEVNDQIDYNNQPIDYEIA